MIASNTVINHNQQGCFITNASGEIIYPDKGLCQMLGFAATELMHKPPVFLLEGSAGPLGLQPAYHFARANEWEGEVFLLNNKGEHVRAGLHSVMVQEEGLQLRLNTLTFRVPQVNSINDIDINLNVQEELHLLTNYTEHGFVLVDENLRIITFNRIFTDRYQKIIGRQVLRGANVLDYAISENKQGIEAIYRRVLAGETIETEIELKHPAGRFIFSIRYKPVPYGGPGKNAVFVTTTDITAQKMVELKLKQNELRFQLLIETNIDCIAILNAQARLVYVSPAITNLLGYTPVECLYKDTLSFIHTCNLPQARESWKEILANPGLTFKRQAMRMRHKDGTWRWIQETFTNLLHEPAVAGIVKNCRDVSDMVIAHEDLMQKQYQVELAETNYREIFEKGNDGILLFDAETGLLTEVNNKACSIFGCCRMEMLESPRKRFQADVPGFETHKIMQKFEQALHGEPVFFEWMFKRADGVHCWVEVSLKRATVAGCERILAFFRNIDHRKQTQEELQRLSHIARETNNAVVITDVEGRIEWVNEAFTRIYGYEMQEIMGENPRDFLQGPETSQVVRRYMRMKIRRKESYKCDLVNYSKDGRKYWIRIECQPRLDAQGKHLGFFAMQTDITREKEAEVAVKRSEEKYRNLFEYNPSCIMIWDPERLKILEANLAASKLYGYTHDEFLQLSVLDIRRKEDYDKIKKLALAFTQNDRMSYKGVWDHITKTGEVLPISYTSHVITYNGQKAVLAIGDDITEKIKLEKALEEARTKKQAEITEAVLLAQERERKEIGEELHDNVNQILAGAILYLGLSKNEIEKTLPFLDETEKLLNAAIFELRNMSHLLIPPRLPEQTLADSLENVIKMTGAGGLIVSHEFSALVEENISPKLKLAVYRIVQEQMGNILKHAKATHVHICVAEENEKLVLRIQDDGVGFNTAAKRKGVGLMNIKTRASIFNSEVHIRSAQNAGCELCIYFDLNAEAARAN